jgi:hypothetical protein
MILAYSHFNDVMQVRFDIQYQTNAAVECGAMVTGTAVAYVKNQREDGWKFEFKSIDSRHVMTLALGPLSAALASFQSSAWAGIDISLQSRSSLQPPNSYHHHHHHMDNFQFPQLEHQTLQSLSPRDDAITL